MFQAQQAHHAATDSIIEVLEVESSGFYTLTNLKTIASGLSFNTVPRMTRDGTAKISVHNKKEASEILRSQIFDLESKVLKGSKLSAEVRREIREYAATILFYDHGYKTVHGLSQLTRTWAKRQHEAYVKGNNVHPYCHLRKSRTKYTDKIEQQYPQRLHELYRYAEKVNSNQATFEALAASMNNKASIDYPEMELRMNTNKIYRWFKTQGGNEKSSLPKPLVTPEMKPERLDWAKDNKKLLKKHGTKFYACFLDEKWFYTTSRQRKQKILPPGPGEDPKEVEPFQDKTTSRRNVVKVGSHRGLGVDCYVIFFVIQCPQHPSPFDCYVLLFRSWQWLSFHDPILNIIIMERFS